MTHGLQVLENDYGHLPVYRDVGAWVYLATALRAFDMPGLVWLAGHIRHLTPHSKANPREHLKLHTRRYRHIIAPHKCQTSALISGKSRLYIYQQINNHIRGKKLPRPIELIFMFLVMHPNNQINPCNAAHHSYCSDCIKRHQHCLLL